MAALPGTSVVAAAAGTIGLARLYAAMRTGVPELDRLRWPVLWALVTRARTRLLTNGVAIARRYMAMLRQEGAYKPGDRELGAEFYPLGDRGFVGRDPDGPGPALALYGPAVGPGQVLLAHAHRLGWTGGAEELAHVSNAGRALGYSVAVFVEELDRAAGDVELATRRYNGSGPAAAAYLASVQAHERGFFG